MPNLPISEFLTERMSEYDPGFELRKGTGFEQLFFKPLQFIVQPLRDEADDIQIAQSFRQVLLTDSPDDFSEEEVDDLASNLFVDRREGNSAGGVAKAFYNNPVAREYATNSAVFVGNNGVNYINPSPFSITEAQMSQQIENGLYYFEIPVEAQDPGENTDIEASGLVQLLDDPDYVSVTNDVAFIDGLDRETNTELIERTKNSIAVRDLVTGKGFNAILFENFSSSLKELRPIGFGDEEMMRDILFNTHVGGKVDGYFTAPSIRQGSQNFIGLLIDTTRQAPATSNVTLNGTLYSSMGNPGIDRTNADPLVEQVKVRLPASYTSPVNLLSPVDLSLNQRVKITIDGVTKEVRVAGVNPTSTNRNEIIGLINTAFGVDVIFPTAVSVRIKSPISGLESEIILEDPDVISAGSALTPVFGLASPGPHFYSGDGPITFIESTHYEINDVDGEIRRVLGSSVVGSNSNGETFSTNVFSDATLSVFAPVVENDILKIESGADAGDYRILAVTDANNLILDATLTASATGVQYSISRTGIKDGEVVFCSYEFNPLSIDVGGLVKLDPEGKTRGVRLGREDVTITDTAFLRINRIAVIDPLTFEETGVVLEGLGGFGLGGFGLGGFGVGSNADYRLQVNEPHERFSSFEDSYIVINQGFQGLSLKVEYDYVPECDDLHDFVRSENERVLDGDILMKHFLPAYVSGTIEYRVDETDLTIPTNEDLTELVKEFIRDVPSGEDLELSDITQYILSLVDPSNRYSAFVRPFTLSAVIHNVDGTSSSVQSDENLAFPILDPFPKDTDRPFSPRISHWFGDNITLVRLES